MSRFNVRKHDSLFSLCQACFFHTCQKTQAPHRITKIVALNRAGAGEKYFENPAALSFVIAPLLCTVKRITEVMCLQQKNHIIIDIGNVIVISIAIANNIVIHTAHFENFLHR